MGTEPWGRGDEPAHADRPDPPVGRLLAAAAQPTLKHGMDQVVERTGVLRLEADSLKTIVSTPAVWAGLLLFGLSAFVWLAVLSRTSRRSRTRSRRSRTC